MASLRTILPVLILTTLAGCGGSGGSSPKPPALGVRFEKLTSTLGNPVPMAVSADGSATMGNAHNGQQVTPLVWKGSTMGATVPDPGAPTLYTLRTMSSDGGSWLGDGLSAGKSVAIFGTTSGQKRVLPLLSGASGGRPVDLSADGSVALCLATYGIGIYSGIPYLVVGDVVTALPMPPEGTLGNTNATAISADGRVAVGQAGGRAARWEGGELRTLSTRDSSATDVSADGSVVVGWLVGSQGENVPFQWTEVGGLQELPTVAGARYSIAAAVSADGGTVAINAFDVVQDRERVFLWREGVGMQDLADVVRELEPRVAFDGTRVAAMSADGKIIVGGGWTSYKGTTLPAWRLVLP